MIWGPNFVGLKPHVPSLKQLERLLYTDGENCSNLLKCDFPSQTLIPYNLYGSPMMC